MLRILNTPNFENHKRALEELGVLNETRADGSVVARTDAAGDTAILAREVEFVSAQSYQVLTDPIKGRLFVKFTTVPDGADSWNYDMWDRIALVEWLTNYSSAVGSADVFKKRTPKAFYDYGSSYKYSVQDLQRAAYAGVPLERERALSCRIGHEQFLDNVIAVGDSDRGIEGLTNSTAFQEVVPTAGEWDFSAAEPTDPDDYEAKSTALENDLSALLNAVEQNSAENFTADTLILPLSAKPVLDRRFSRYDSTSRLNALKAKFPGVTVHFWKRLNTASEAGGPKAIAYKNTQMVLEFVLKYDFRELPPQAEGYAYQVLTHGAVGGLHVRYPLACARMDLDAEAAE